MVAFVVLPTMFPVEMEDTKIKSPEPDDIACQEKAKAFYPLVRELVTLEDSLVNHRLTWFMTLQGFLYAAYGVLLQGLAQSESSQQQGTQTFVAIFNDTRHIISLVGFVSSFIALLGVTAAFRAIRFHVGQLDQFTPKSGVELPIYPRATGEPCTSAMGAIAAIALPALASAPWPRLGGWLPQMVWVGWLAALLSFIAAILFVFRGVSQRKTKVNHASPSA